MLRVQPFVSVLGFLLQDVGLEFELSCTFILEHEVIGRYFWMWECNRSVNFNSFLYYLQEEKSLEMYLDVNYSSLALAPQL